MSVKDQVDDYKNRLTALEFAYQQIKAAKQVHSQALVERYKSDLIDITRLYDKLPPPQPEIWTIPKIFNKTHDEIFISKYIAYILDPRKNGIGDAPLRKLLGLISPEFGQWSFQKAEIIREFPLLERSIDFLILLDDTLIIGLENKVFAPEGYEQTTFYAQELDQLFNERQRLYIFLTINGSKALSDKFHAISYQQLLTALNTIQFPEDDLKKRALWEDFLMHVEEHLTMNSTKLDIPEPEKPALFLKHHEMIKDLSSAYENSREAVFNLVAQDIQLAFGDSEWKNDFNSARTWQKIYKPHWVLDNPPIRVMLVLWFSREILLTNEFTISIEVQGREKWDTQEEVKLFFNQFQPRYEALKHVYKEKGMHYLTTLPERVQLAKLGLAWKKYPMIINPDQIDMVSKPIIQAIQEFEFLIEPIDETLREIQIKN